MKWTKVKDFDCAGGTLHYYGTGRCTGRDSRGIEIYSCSEDTGHSRFTFSGSGRMIETPIHRIRRSIAVIYGPWGEASVRHEMPFGSTIKEAQAKALQIAREVDGGKYGNDDGVQFNL